MYARVLLLLQSSVNFLLFPNVIRKQQLPLPGFTVQSIKALADTLDKVERALNSSGDRLEKARNVAAQSSYEDVVLLPGNETRRFGNPSAHASKDDGRLGKFGSRSINDIAHMTNKASPRTSPFSSSHGIALATRPTVARSPVMSATSFESIKSKSQSIQDVTSRLTDPSNFPAATKVRMERAAAEKNRESGSMGSLNNISTKSSAKADKVVKRLTDPKKFTGTSRQNLAHDKRSDSGFVNGYQPPADSEKEKLRLKNKMEFFKTASPDEPALAIEAEIQQPEAPKLPTAAQAGIASWL
ncbi:hypothetical protein SeLEV6574_g08266 [Synchytrium endobioticum]|uniref:Uncharacterized protein n=1 Tax=Synchytrium endobioticum TaxID=286115 RepID=A0A507CAS4_9FUNG|nr:hypothetical protein SeLEV6574_g08266 [Synchytrium endobioticum]